MKRIALTGGIAEGKSVILGIVASHGIKTISADEVVREIRTEPEVRSAISAKMGLDEEASVDAIRARVSEDSEFRRWLNHLLHAATLRRMLESEAQVFEVPLLIETCTQGRFDRVWVATCGKEEQMRRLIERTGDRATAEKLLATQLPTEVKAAFADRILRTNVPLSHVQSDVLSALVAESLV